MRTSKYHRSGTLLIVAILSVAVLTTACADQPSAEPGSSAETSLYRQTPTPVTNIESTTKEASMANKYSSQPEMIIDVTKAYKATMVTSEGTIVFNLLTTDAPLTVNNFVFLSQEGYYDGVTFHRIVKDFMVQSGDPTGTGMGGPGYRFQDEPVTREYSPGTLAMANSGPNTNGSQFFIMHGAVPLPPQYTIFGETIDGLDVVDLIANLPVVMSPSGELSKPASPPTIQTITISSE